MKRLLLVLTLVILSAISSAQESRKEDRSRIDSLISAITAVRNNRSLESYIPLEVSLIKPHINPVFPADTTLPVVVVHLVFDTLGRSVGSIPFTESITPTGGKMYSVPIATASQSAFSPQVSIVYNSQAGEGMIGYGWNIAGLPKITLINRNKYYHGTFRAADYEGTDEVYALDGDPLVQNDFQGVDTTYTLISAHAKVLVKKVLQANGRPKYFEALYPDGSSAVFGYKNLAFADTDFPITEQKDAFGNVIRYSYTAPYGVYYPELIEYGFMGQEQPRASISFDYEWDEPYSLCYKAGKEYSNCLWLNSITSYYQGQELRSYSFSNEREDIRNYITGIGCSVGQSELIPLRFRYEKDKSGYSPVDDFNAPDTLKTSLSFTSADNLVFKRGRCVPGVFDEGVIAYPAKSTYRDRINMFGYHFYWSDYDDSDRIMVCLRQQGQYVGTSYIDCDYGFQTVEAADIDGDGVDEIVTVNYNGIPQDSTELRISVYRYEQPNLRLSGTSFTTKVFRSRNTSPYKSPVECGYYFGDFRGVGREELLVISCNGDYSSRAAIIDLQAGNKVFEYNSFSFSSSDISYSFVGDLDSDGQQNLYIPRSDGIYRALYVPGLAYYGLSSTRFGPKKSAFERGVMMGIFNQDGYPDFLVRGATSQQKDTVRMNAGRHSLGYNIVVSALSSDNDKYFVTDLDKNGNSDIVLISGTNLKYLLNYEGWYGSNYTTSSVSVSSNAKVIGLGLRSLGTECDLMTLEGSSILLYRFGRDIREERRLSTMVESLGIEHRNTYSRISSPESSCYSQDNNRTYTSSNGYHRDVFPLEVVQEDQVWLFPPGTGGGTMVSDRTYSYKDAVIHSMGLGFCGFGEVGIVDEVSGTKAVTVNNPETMGVPIKTITKLSGFPGTVIDSTVIAWQPNVTTYRKMNPRISSTSGADIVTGVRKGSVFQYDSLDFVISQSSWQDIAAVPDSSSLQETYTHYSHHLSDSLYKLGEVSSVVTTVTDLPSENQFTTNTTFDYNTFGQPARVRKWVGLPEDDYTYGDVLVMTDSLSYDSRGRLVYKGSAPRGSTQYVGADYGYIGATNLLDNSHDEYGRWYEYMYYDKYGNPSWIWNENEYWRTDFTYDAWGRQTGVRHHDGTRDTTSTRWSTVGLYKVWTKKAGQPETVVHYDAAGREVRRSDKRFDGSWRHVDTEYNGKGQVARVSLPYKGNSPSQWTSYHYDVFGRVDTVYAANGRKDVTIYDGRRTTTTQNGVRRTITENARGEVIRSTDAAGSVINAYRADGKLAASTAPGNATTTFEYDFTGRRTQMVSPGAGTHTYSYSINTATGVQTTVHTSPEGTVTSTSDKYGRLVSRVNGSDFSTSWTYYDRLLHSEVSTNGTRKDYTYDEHERPTSVKETGLDGEWLKQVFTWNNDEDGHLKSTLFVCDTDTLGTERYYYENGYKTVTSFLPYNAASPSDTIIVWKLTSENGLGLPTEGRSAGNIQRTYSYDAYGRPTGRTLGSVMDFGYTYDQNDNLASRSDNLRNLSESFTYDSLDRLTGAGTGNRTRSYAPNGNVTADSAVGNYLYQDSSNPYKQTETVATWTTQFELFEPEVTMNSFSRPSYLTEGNVDLYQHSLNALFDYNGSYSLFRIGIYEDDWPLYSRYYLGGRFDREVHDLWEFNDVLYLGGDAKSAPVALHRYWDDCDNPVEEAVWNVYNIGRDNMGSPVSLVNESGQEIKAVSYDPWGNSRNVGNWTLDREYVDDIFGRGYTGHIIIPEFYIYHCSARLYNSQTGRFLGYDPYVQDPDNSQNWNRYSYCLNNPLRYTDPSRKYHFYSSNVH